MKKRLTIFTPTYNRKHTLPQLYDSLCRQTCKDFTWLIVDDGSTDGTEALIWQWAAEGKTDIAYHRQANRGKMAAHNKGVGFCATELFVCIDSDDYLASGRVVADLLAFWDANSDVAGLPTTSGMVSYRKMLTGTFSPFPENVSLSTLAQLYEQGFKGETTLVFKTDVLRRHPFPEIDGEKFITEAYVYDQLDRHFQMLVFPHFSQVCEYQPDGFTRNGWDVLFKNPKGYRMYYNQCMKFGRGSFLYNMRMYIACSLLAADGRTFADCDFKLPLLLAYPLGLRQYHRLLNHKW